MHDTIHIQGIVHCKNMYFLIGFRCARNRHWNIVQSYNNLYVWARAAAARAAGGATLRRRADGDDGTGHVDAAAGPPQPVSGWMDGLGVAHVCVTKKRKTYFTHSH